MTPKDDSTNEVAARITERHLTWGWVGLLVFASLGVTLELLHGFKVNMYLNVQNETRRLMWTLSHAHGTFLSLVHIVFAATVFIRQPEHVARMNRASTLFVIAGLLIPAGFFAGGIWVYGGDPNLWILLLPAGALCLLTAIAQTIRLR